MPPPTSSASTPAYSRIFTLVIPSFKSTKSARGVKQESLLPCVPSWNDMLQLEPWGRQQRKKQIQDAFLSALRAYDAASSTKTTSAKSMWSIAADTLELFQTTALVKRASKLASAKLEKKKLSTPSSKSSS